ncbi:sterol desaturase family protein [Sulfurirhabdus autotrophica]|nr:sterol desaturase family protein [Sulfurirhabdus autotrophica]
MAVWIAYPVVMIITLSIYYGLAHQGINWSLASYIAAIIGGVGLITLLENILPYRKDWAPNRAEVQSDVTFMILIQVLLPKLLSIMTAMWLLEYVKSAGWALDEWWPHSYPAWIQMLLMMFVADFPRYWLHRAAHEWTPLWRFHAVHHSVQKLNWINVGRFHPVDKFLQFLCDAMPFILVGVSYEVLALYFVVYSIKGFFQHSNVDIKLGWLNYLISGPELHRWHHSRTIKESNTNYGNNIIVWDILFGTFFLPKGASVGDLGLLNRHYPMGFLSQMKTPFIPGLDKAQQDGNERL